MGKYMINGGRKLCGTVNIESAKNAVLPIIAASVLTDGEVLIKNCPRITDVFNMIKIVNAVGVKTKFINNDLYLRADNIISDKIPVDIGKKLRSSVFMLGALIGRVGKAEVPYPGGCDIGSRPIDIHIDALKTMGVKIKECDDGIKCAMQTKKAEEVRLPIPSVGATENIILASVLSNGTTKIVNAAREPEVEDLICCLKSMGARIDGAGSRIITINGVDKLSGVEYNPVSDRIEAGTYLVAAAATGGEIEIRNAKAQNILPLLHKLCENTCKIRIENDIIYLKSGQGRSAFSFATGPYPFFPTDMQAQTTALLAISEGRSLVYENVFDARFGHVAELNKMGANIKTYGNVAEIIGVRSLHGSDLSAKDLRGGAALVTAALAAEGVSLVDGAEHIERGYSDLVAKLNMLGASVKNIK